MFEVRISEICGPPCSLRVLSTPLFVNGVCFESFVYEIDYGRKRRSGGRLSNLLCWTRLTKTVRVAVKNLLL